ncbi:hypothetical protein BDW74DRAFT_19441 [Aspergillus multicolor]|uniref:uncharacterized protein n=1 Tax=Aspergillus multicolor TaxID=41759 RepID=UPI003CCDB93E
MSTPTPSASASASASNSAQIPSPATLPITTHHCRFCATLLIASTRDLSSLPTRTKNATDGARILPLRTYDLPSTSTSIPENPEPHAQAQTQTRTQTQTHYTILLSTNSRDRKPTIIRRADGFEKRFFLRCGRCRIPVGYFLDEVHFPVSGGKGAVAASGSGTGEDNAGVEGGEGGEGRAVYLLPGALMETEIMSDEEKMEAVDREWGHWFK